MNIEKKVQEWLVDEGMFREKAVDENTDFHFIIEFPKDNIMDVVKPKGKDSVIIGCATKVADQHIDLMTQAKPEKQTEFILDLNMGLNKFLVDFELQINQNILQQFVITECIYEDGLTKDFLIRSLKKVFKAKLHCIWLIEKKFGSITPKQQPSNENSIFV